LQELSLKKQTGFIPEKLIKSVPEKEAKLDKEKFNGF